MSKTEMLERSRKALAEFDSLPPDVQFKQLVEWGVIDQEGEVLFGLHAGESRNQRSSPAGADQLNF